MSEFLCAFNTTCGVVCGLLLMSAIAALVTEVCKAISKIGKKRK